MQNVPALPDNCLQMYTFPYCLVSW